MVKRKDRRWMLRSNTETVSDDSAPPSTVRRSRVQGRGREWGRGSGIGQCSERVFSSGKMALI